MKKSAWIISALLVGSWAAAIPALAAPAAGGAGSPEPKIDPKAKEVLQQMCQTLAGAKQMLFEFKPPRYARRIETLRLE